MCPKQSNDPQLGCPRCGVNGSMVVLFIPHRQRREFRAVNRDFASSLIQLNNTFYREHSASFSDTRQAPWPGWVRTMDIALEQLDVATIEHPVRVSISPAADGDSRTLPPAARLPPRA